jgi:hypothetical protein
VVVFGSAGWVTDDALMGNEAILRVNLFSSCVSWLRGKASLGQSREGKKRTPYRLNLAATETTRLRFLPLSLLMLSVVGLGMGVWVVRRR